uniref:Immunoglobulin domain-containing protein n=1 Tax=Mastacembelus armatus TaxID=205130 RepID=A0A3Q3S8S1_9TELE
MDAASNEEVKIQLRTQLHFYSLTGENTPARQTEAYVGGNVTINCTYQKTEENNIKTFCRKKENFNCTDVISTHNAVYTQLDRISLTNNKEQQIYTVRISMLTQEDAGTYQCVTKSIYNDSSTCLTEIRLDILSKWIFLDISFYWGKCTNSMFLSKQPREQ